MNFLKRALTGLDSKYKIDSLNGIGRKSVTSKFTLVGCYLFVECSFPNEAFLTQKVEGRLGVKCIPASVLLRLGFVSLVIESEAVHAGS